MRNTWNLLAVIFLISTGQARAQEKQLMIRGKVFDSATVRPVVGATIILQSGKMTTVSNVLTDSAGNFSFEKLGALPYTVVISATGYEGKMIWVDLGDSAKLVTDLGLILLKSQGKLLEKVVISGQRRLVKREIDRLVYDVQADPGNKVENALDMMRKVPLLSVDEDGNVELKGSSNYKILINGKPSSMFDRNAKDLFRSIPASDIQRIEVITVPPAKYESEGLAGILNIITTKKIDNGYNGSINIDDRFPVGEFDAGGSFNAKQDNFGASGFGGIGIYDVPGTRTTMNRTATGIDPEFLMQNSINRSDQLSGYFSTDLSYEMDSLHLFTASINYDRNKTRPMTVQQTQITDAMKNVLQQFDLVNSSMNNSLGYGGDFNYQLGFRRKKEELLTFSYNYNNSNIDQFGILSFSNGVNFASSGYQQTDKEVLVEQTFQVDYSLPIDKKINIAVGIKDILRNNMSNFQYNPRNDTTGAYVLDSSLSNKFKYKLNVLGSYASLNYNYSDWSINAGLRVEQTSVTSDFDVNQHYFNVIPSVAAGKKLKGMNTLTLGFAQRIQRPNIWSLNPFVDRANPDFESTGNPDLRSAISNNIELNYATSGKVAFNVGINYTFINNAVQIVTTYDSSTKITTRSLENVGKDKSIGSNFSFNYAITDRWNFNINGFLSYIWIRGMVDSLQASNTGLRGTFSMAAGYKFNKGWYLNANMEYISPRVTLQGQTSTLVTYSLEGGKGLFKDKLTLSGAINNPFAKYLYFIGHTSGYNFFHTGESQHYYRSFNLTLNWRFGRLKKEIQLNKRGIKNEDNMDKGGADK